MLCLRIHSAKLIDCGLVTPNGYIDLSQHWFRSWLVAWRHQVITWTNVDLLPMRPNNNHLRTVSQKILQPYITKISLKISSKIALNLPETNELITADVASVGHEVVFCNFKLSPKCCFCVAVLYKIPWHGHSVVWKIQYIPRNMHTVLLCFALLWLCNRSQWIHMKYLSIFIRVALLALGQSLDCHSASEVSLMDMGKSVNVLPQQSTAKQKPCAYFLGYTVCITGMFTRITHGGSRNTQRSP